MAIRKRKHGVVKAKNARGFLADPAPAFSSAYHRSVAEIFTRRDRVRSSLLIGTAIGAGFLAMMCTNVQPAMALTAADCTTGNCPAGDYPTGITYDYQTQDLTVITNGTTTIETGPHNNGIEIGTGNPNGIYDFPAPGGHLTFGVTTSSGTTIGSSTTPITGDGIHVYNRVGNATAATTTISNSAPIFANGFGIYSFTSANSVNDPIVNDKQTNTVAITSGLSAMKSTAVATDPGVGPSKAYSSLKNSGPLVVTLGGDAGMESYAHAVTVGGYSLASSYISNSGTVTNKTGNHALDGDSNANANLGNGAGTAQAGTAVAITQIVNSKGGTLYSNNDTIDANATARARSYSDSKSYGGTATATVQITNAGDITSKNDGGIDGRSNASATARGYSGFNNALIAKGGSATATTGVTNSGAIITKDDERGINAVAEAYARAHATNTNGYDKTTKLFYSGVGTGGTAVAIVNVTNSGNLGSSKYYTERGISGYSFASTSANGFIATGGNSKSTVTITNTGGVIFSEGRGINGYAVAGANGNGYNGTSAKGKYLGTGTGGTANANVTITNTGGVTSKWSRGIKGTTVAYANGSGFVGKGGTATATTSMYNAATIKSRNDSVVGAAFSRANGYGSYSKGGIATGGTATSTVLITNKGGALTSTNSEGIVGYSYSQANGGSSNSRAYTAQGGTAKSSTNISNTGVVISHWDGIDGEARAYANGYGAYTGSKGVGGAGTGGHAEAAVVINNTGGSITSSNADGIDGFALAVSNGSGYTGKGGTTTSIATMNINNTVAITAWGDAIVGGAVAISDGTGVNAFGGKAYASTNITNSGVLISKNGEGIDGFTYSSASAFGTTGNSKATGGVATGTTSIYNSGPITAYNGDGIRGSSTVHADAFGGSAKGGTGTGGTATASVVIVNTASGAIVEKGTNKEAIDGFALASANGTGYTAKGGTAVANVGITNSGHLLSYYGTGIKGIAISTAIATAPTNYASATATGGTATAGVVITNAGQIDAGQMGILGVSTAIAGAIGYTAKGGTATANTNITNSGKITTTGEGFLGDGITGVSIALADGFSSTSAQKSSATGGTSSATTVIVNNKGADIFTPYANGIVGFSLASSSAVGFHAYGGKATANTTVYNAAKIVADDAIDAFSVALAIAVGSPNVDPGIAKGGTAIANTLVSNSGNLTTLNGKYSNGDTIRAFSGAFATAIGLQATGGSATATTTVTNSGKLQAYGSGIHATSWADASALSSGGLLSSAKGGTAVSKTTVISTGPTINAQNGYGIYAASKSTAVAQGGFVGGTGGTASATTSVTNSASIFSYRAGIVSKAFADASSTGYGGIAGTAVANATVTNTAAVINTYGSNAPGIYVSNVAVANGGPAGGAGGTVGETSNVSNGAGSVIHTYGSNSPGIIAFTGSYASGYYAGSAKATANATNAGTIATFGSNSPGMVASSRAVALGYTAGSPVANAGTAVAIATATNTGVIKTYGSYSPGILAISRAYAGTYTAGPASTGVASASTSVTNTGNILTYGPNSPGIAAYSVAISNGTAVAVTNVTNSGTIVTYGYNSPGIVAQSYAGGRFGAPAIQANAATSVTNSGTIVTYGAYSPGILATAVANGDPATATVNVANTGTIITHGGYSNGEGNRYVFNTYGYNSPGILAVAIATVDATALTNVTNTGTIVTYGNSSPGIVALALAKDTKAAATAATTVTNTGQITTYGFNSPGVIANAAAYSLGKGATATTTVSNSGGISTYGSQSPGIVAGTFVGPASGASTASTTVNNTGVVSTYGSRSPGIYAYAATSLNAGSTASVLVSNSGSVQTNGVYSYGVLANAFGGKLATTTVTNSGTVSTTGYGATGVAANASTALAGGTATVTINNSGTIQTAGNGGFKYTPGGIYLGFYNGASAIYATSKASSVATTTINNAANGVITTSGGYSPAVRAYARGTAGGSTAAVNISNAGTIQTTGIFSNAIIAGVLGGTNTSIQITNAATGLIEAQNFPYTAVQAFGAATKIDNAGKLYGNVQLSAFNDVLNNTGIWRMQGNSNFGTGNDAVNNSGIVSMLNSVGDLAVAGATVNTGVPPITGVLFHTVFVNGLENFNNTGGLVTMINGNPNQQIVLAGNFNGSGNSRLAVDAFLGGPGSTADLLTVKGNTTGNTHIIVNDTNPGLGAYNPIGIPVVIVGGNTVVGNFDLPQGPIHKGLFDYDLFLRPDKVWVLASAPNQAANELPRLVTATHNIWDRTAGMWLDRTADLRAGLFNAPPCGGGGADLPVKGYRPVCADTSGVGVWMNGFGDWSKNKSDVFTTLFGQTKTFDVNFDQSIYGFQAGLDWATSRRGPSAWIFGVTGGYVGSTVKFNSTNRATFDGGTAGAYATYLNRGFFVDALFMANFLTLKFNDQLNPNLGLGHMGVNSFGGHIDTGYRFQMPQNWFFEPQAAIQYVTTDFDNKTVLGTNVGLDGDAFKGRLGGRVGTTWLGSGVKWEPSVTASVWHRFTGDNVATLSGNGFNFDLVDTNSVKTYGEIGAALNVFSIGSVWSAFVKGDYRFGDNYSGGSVKGGARAQW